MNFEFTKPEEPGWYWFRHSLEHDWGIMQVWKGYHSLMCRNFTDEGNFVNNYCGQWIKLDAPSRDP